MSDMKEALRKLLDSDADELELGRQVSAVLQDHAPQTLDLTVAMRVIDTGPGIRAKVVQLRRNRELIHAGGPAHEWNAMHLSKLLKIVGDSEVRITGAQMNGEPLKS